MSTPLLVARFASAADYLAVHSAEVVQGGLLVRGATLAPGTPLGDCTLRVEVAGEAPVELPARLGGNTAGLGVLVLFGAAPGPLLSLAARLSGAGGPDAPGPGAGDDDAAAAGEETEEEAGEEPPGEEPEPPGAPAHRQREVLPLAEKMRLASSCDRELRFALLRDPNKQLHPLVLKNPRIGLDEVLWAARLGSLNPDALKLIADHPEWGKTPTIATALVRNPKTLVPVALRLLPRLPLSEVKAIARSQGRTQIVGAARKLVANQH